MRSFFGFTIITVFLLSCDEQRVYEKNQDFDSRYWLVSEKPEFEFEIRDTLQSYNLYCNVRNSLDYPFARIFITYHLKDSTGLVTDKNLVSALLFNEKTGKPFGDSGLGDLYDHQIALKQDYRFPRSGKYKVSFEQYMRTDTLAGILAVGLRVEKKSLPE
ncbi:MAG TPA: gliding motility lipoprotein GldH [Chryseosolibacter sp.]|jgi:gliding motility-associated lipoprotein GldH